MISYEMPTLETTQLILRRVCETDLNDIASWYEDILPKARHHTAAVEFLRFCFSSYLKWGWGPWGIQLKANGVLIGNCGFYHLDLQQRRGEVNYFVASPYRGRGIATEALRAVIQFGLFDFGLLVVQARCDADNVSSERVLQKARMRFEKMADLDEKLYVITRGELQNCAGDTRKVEI